MQNITINKTNATREIDFDSLPDNAKSFVIEYGLKQLLNDCHSSIARKDYESQEDFEKDVHEKVDAKITSLKDGSLTIRSASVRAPADPVGKEVHKIANDILLEAIRAHGTTKKAIGAEKWNALLSDLIEKNKDSYTKQAKKNIKEREELNAGIEIDLTSLM